MDRRLDILHIAPNYAPLLATSGGIAVHRHAGAQAGQGLAVAVAIVPYSLDGRVPCRGVALRHPPAPVHVAGFSTYQVVVEREPLVELRALLEHRRPRVIHYHQTYHSTCVVPLAAALGIPVVYTDHLPVGDPEWLERECQRRNTNEPSPWKCIRHADRVITFVEAGRQRIARFVPEAAARIRVVGHGVEDRPELRELAFARRARSPVQVLFVGRFVPEKGIDELLAAIPLALERCEDLRFSLLGQRDQEPPPVPWPERIPEAYRGRVRFLPWSEQAVVERELAAADVFVAPSRFESFGMAVAEAMLLGLPVVGTPTEGLTALLEPAGCGVLVPCRDPASLAAAIVGLAEDPARRLELGRRAAVHARERLGWEAVARQMIAVYRELADIDGVA
jgi:glycosyltransferase involved in cell wall biosynthesis